MSEKFTKIVDSYCAVINITLTIVNKNEQNINIKDEVIIIKHLS